MITIIDYAIREKQDGSKFVALILQGSPQMVKSVNTGKYYFTVRETSIPSTLDEKGAKMVIGNSMAGDIVKVKVEDPYEYSTTSGDKILLDFSWEYRDNSDNVEEKLFS
jgi:hypothetical protein